MLTLLHAAIPGHASMIMPPSRNSIDAELPAWDHGKHPSTGWIEPYSCTCTNGTEAECNSGQSCFWFSQGCTIGCKACDGDGRRYPSYDHCPGTPSALKVPTYLDKKWWTANHNATPGSYEDIWRFNPWRAPGHAPVWDACGMAGGSPKEVFNAGAYNTTVHAEPPSLIFLTLTLTLTLTFHPHPNPNPNPNPHPNQVRDALTAHRGCPPWRAPHRCHLASHAARRRAGAPTPALAPAPALALALALTPTLARALALTLTLALALT